MPVVQLFAVSSTTIWPKTFFMGAETSKGTIYLVVPHLASYTRFWVFFLSSPQRYKEDLGAFIRGSGGWGCILPSVWVISVKDLLFSFFRVPHGDMI